MHNIYNSCGQIYELQIAIASCCNLFCLFNYLCKCLLCYCAILLVIFFLMLKSFLYECLRRRVSNVHTSQLSFPVDTGFSIYKFENSFQSKRFNSRKISICVEPPNRTFNFVIFYVFLFVIYYFIKPLLVKFSIIRTQSYLSEKNI